MAEPNAVPAFPMGIPTKGLNRRDPLTRMDPAHTPWCVNWDIEAQRLRLRGGYVIHQTLPPGRIVQGLLAHNNTKLFAYAIRVGPPLNDIEVYDVTSTPTLVDTLGSEIDLPSAVKHAKHSFFVPDQGSDSNRTGAYFDGSTWSDWGFTSSATPIGGAAAVSYKGRLYIADGTNIYYSTIGQVTGEVDGIFDVSDLLVEEAAVNWLAVLTGPGSQHGTSLLCFGNNEGEVLVYAGSYPESSDWEQVASFDLPRLHTSASIRPAILQKFNDVWISTTAGVFSLRALLVSGDDSPEDTSPSNVINDYWSKIFRTAFDAGTNIASSIAYWPERNKVFWLASGFVDQDGSRDATQSTMLIWNRHQRAWSLHQLPCVASGLTYFNNGMYFRTADGHIWTLDETVSKDEDINNPGSYLAFDHALHGAYTSLGTANRHKQVQSIQAVIETDFDGGHLTAKAAADMGREVSVATSQALQNGYSFPTYRTSVKGTYLQYRLEGTSDTDSEDGLTLHAINLGIE